MQGGGNVSVPIVQIFACDVYSLCCLFVWSDVSVKYHMKSNTMPQWTQKCGIWMASLASRLICSGLKRFPTCEAASLDQNPFLKKEKSSWHIFLRQSQQGRGAKLWKQWSRLSLYLAESKLPLSSCLEESVACHQKELGAAVRQQLFSQRVSWHWLGFILVQYKNCWLCHSVCFRKGSILNFIFVFFLRAFGYFFSPCWPCSKNQEDPGRAA